MTRFLFPVLIVAANPATAHVGHVGEVAGHDHWVAGIALGVALGVSLWGALKGKTDTPEPADPEDAATDEAPEDTQQETPA